MSIADEQREFFLGLYHRHGDDPRALSHRDAVTQRERFSRIARLFDDERAGYEVHEIGCGLGHFGEFLEREHPDARYSGSEICEEFVDACRRRFSGEFHLRDVTAQLPSERYDYVTLSGTFNIRLGRSDEEWQIFVFDMLRSMYALCRKGIAADFLTTYHDPDYTRPDLYYQEPQRLTDFVVRELSRHYELDAGGPLYEYALRVYRPEFLERRYAEPEFDRYFRRRPQ